MKLCHKSRFLLQLWVTLSERYLSGKGVDWPKAERFCFNEWSNPDDDELGLQIVRVSFLSQTILGPKMADSTIPFRTSTELDAVSFAARTPMQKPIRDNMFGY